MVVGVIPSPAPFVALPELVVAVEFAVFELEPQAVSVKASKASVTSAPVDACWRRYPTACPLGVVERVLNHNVEDTNSECNIRY